MKFKTRMINAAVAAALGTVAGTAQAVNLSPDGIGQVLIYPYYTVQSRGNGSNPTVPAFDTYISVINSDTQNGKAVKVRFLDGLNSIEVLDFNLYLSPNDMWTAALTRDTNGNGVMMTNDNSCTVPEIFACTPAQLVGGQMTPGGCTGSSTVAGVPRGVHFGNAGFITAADGLGTGLDRAREGYLEIIQMADIVLGQSTNGPPALNTYNASLHNAAGVPPNCAGIRNAWSPTGPTNDYNTPPGDGVGLPTGGLSGSGTVINPLEGQASSYDAVALDRFSATKLHFQPGDITPQLGDVNPKRSTVLIGTNVVTTNWTGQFPVVLPVSAVLMRNQIINVYDVVAGSTGVKTDWVVTMPTKFEHIGTGALPPFSHLMTTTGSCDDVTANRFDREEQTHNVPQGFSPPPPEGSPGTLCWEANVIAINSDTGIISDVLGSKNVQGSGNTRQSITVPTLTTTPPNAFDGWMRLVFNESVFSPGATRVYDFETGVVTGSTAIGSGLNATYTGLPVVGFAAESLNGGIVTSGVLSNYGSFYGHAYYRNIVTLP